MCFWSVLKKVLGLGGVMEGMMFYCVCVFFFTTLYFKTSYVNVCYLESKVRVFSCSFFLGLGVLLGLV